MKNKILRHVGRAILYAILVGIIAPILDLLELAWRGASEPLSAFEAYVNPWYWLCIAIAVAAIYILVLYFREIKPRNFVFLYDIMQTTVLVCLLIGAEVLALLYAVVGLSDHKALLILALIACGVVFLFGIYAITCRGVAIYQDGKVRIFKFRIYTYQTGEVEDLRLEYQGRICYVHVVVQGHDHVFKISAGTAKAVEHRLTMLAKNGEIEKIDP